MTIPYVYDMTEQEGYPFSEEGGGVTAYLIRNHFKLDFGICYHLTCSAKLSERSILNALTKIEFPFARVRVIL